MKPQPFLFINILFISCLTSISTDIYTPSLAAIADSLHTSTDKAELSVTIFMVGLALSQLFYGPISEGFGRRKPLIAGLCIFLAGSVLCLYSKNIGTLLMGRLIQGLGAGANSTLWRTVFRDAWQGEELAKYGAWLSIIVTFFMPAIPVLGGYLQHYIGWQASFAFLAIYSVLSLFLIIVVFKETSLHHHRDKLKPDYIIQAFKQLLQSRLFMGYTICVFFCYGAYFSWFAIGPVLLIKHLGLSPVAFGWLSFLTGAGAMVFAGTFNARFVKRFGSKKMLRMGWSLMFLAGCLLLTGQLLLGLNLYTIILSLFIFYFGTTLIWPNVFAAAFTPFGKIAGFAGSLYSFLQLGGGAIIGSFTASLPSTSPLPLALLFIIAPILAWLSVELLVERKTL